jgi:dihydrofolate synthase/folylpolyglutamate synthase
MNYADAIQFLYGLRWFGTKLGLENAFKLAELAGNPQKRLRFIHVAGTNGKGSTCAMLESIYRAAGLRVGLFTSPHLVSFAERIQVNRQLIPEEVVARLVSDFKPLLKRFPAEAHPTFFEMVTVMALHFFAEQQCDLVVWETGLGGRLDATNIVTPLASVITNVQFDHQQWLGHALAEIAREKAGIIKQGVPVVTAADAPEALWVITETARQARAPLTVVVPTDSRRPPLDSIALPLLGEHQRLNAALAVATIRTLTEKMPVPESAIRAGLECVQWAGRLQLVKTEAGQTILLDGAHNPAGAEALRNALEQHFAGPPRALLLGVLRDKDCEGICRSLAPLAGRIFVSPLKSERTAAPELLADLCRRQNSHAAITVCASVPEALRQAQDCPLLVATGSLYLVGEVLEALEIVAGQQTDERALNEWNANGVSRGMSH